LQCSSRSPSWISKGKGENIGEGRGVNGKKRKRRVGGLLLRDRDGKGRERGKWRKGKGKESGLV